MVGRAFTLRVSDRNNLSGKRRGDCQLADPLLGRADRVLRLGHLGLRISDTTACVCQLILCSFQLLAGFGRVDDNKLVPFFDLIPYLYQNLADRSLQISAKLLALFGGGAAASLYVGFQHAPAGGRCLRNRFLRPRIAGLQNKEDAQCDQKHHHRNADANAHAFVEPALFSDSFYRHICCVSACPTPRCQPPRFPPARKPWIRWSRFWRRVRRLSGPACSAAFFLRSYSYSFLFSILMGINRTRPVIGTLHYTVSRTGLSTDSTKL